MSSPVNLDVLARDDVRTAILLAELGGWLHMIGKMDNSFLCSQAQDRSVNYDERDISNLWNVAHAALCALLTDNRMQAQLALANLPELATAPACLDRFVRDHRKERDVPVPSEAVLRLLQDAHGMASNTEKGTLPREEGKQTIRKTFAATAFGYEAATENIATRNLDLLRVLAVNAVENTLNRIQSDSLSESDWAVLRNNLLTTLSNTLSQTVGDTRRPANEVTLWDQTVTAAALLKTGLVQNVLNGTWRDPSVTAFVDKYRWRFLRIYFDSLAFIGQAHHPTDLRGRLEALERAQQAVKQLLEVTYPLAAEAYHDEANIIFVVPDVADLLTATLTHNGITVTLEQRIRQVFAATLEDELEPQVWLGERSRGAVNLGQTLRAELPSPQPNPDALQLWWKSATDELCAVCRVRPQGYGQGNATKARSRNVCCICLNRREQRSAAWACSLSDFTVWVDEVADDNGRVALIAGRFDLSGWLDGSYFGSLAGRKLPCDAGLGSAPTDYDGVINELKTKELRQRNVGRATPLLRAFIRSTSLAAGEALPNNRTDEAYEALVTERDLIGTAPNPPSADDRAARLLFQGFFSKPTSFARLRRVWETTRQFWEEAQASLPSTVGRRKLRLVLRGQLSNSLGPSHAYDMRVGKVETSFVWDGQRLISADNLSYLAKQLGLEEASASDERVVAEAVKQRLEAEAQLTLLETRSQQGRPQQAAVLRQFYTDLEEHNYLPATPLLREPQVFMTLVPADKAMKVITHLRTAYEVQMSKVRNRFPLHLNLLVFNRRLPLYVAIDSARRMLARQTCSDAEWQVEAVDAHSDLRFGNHVKQLMLAPTDGWASKQVKSFVSYSLGDGNEDFYYPYFFVAKANEDTGAGGKPLAHRPHRWQAAHPTHPTALCDLVHVNELCKGDRVLYAPSTFDFEFLDVARRRFELDYSDEGVRLLSAHRRHPATRPLLLEEIADLETVWEALQCLTESQRHFLVSVIEAKRTEWNVTQADDPTLRRFARDTLRQAGSSWWQDLSNGETRRLLEDWTTNGRLADVVELYEQMLKM